MSIAVPIASAALGGILLSGTIAWAVFAEATVQQPPKPGYKGPEFRTYSASMPPISGFDTFNVNEQNPFVPWTDRDREERRLKQPVAKPAIRVKPPPEIKIKDPPKYAPPRKTEAGGDAPRIRAIYGRDGALAALVEFPGTKTQKALRIGEKAEGWTLMAIEHGTLVVLRDPNGLDIRFVVGETKP